MRGGIRRSTSAWERWARRDPLYGICRWVGKDGPRDLDEFFAMGAADLGQMWRQVAKTGATVPTGGRALDFGCGVGRLTRHLADTFDAVDGVDASETMVRMAREFNREIPALSFHLNQRDDLALFADATFDVAISLVTLQHIPVPAAQKYIGELVRVLRPGGLLAFQLPEREAAQAPARPPGLARRARERLRAAGEEMHAHPESSVRAIVERAGARLSGVIEDGRAGDWGRSLLYVTVRT